MMPRPMWSNRLTRLNSCNRPAMFLLGHDKSSKWRQPVLPGPRGLPRFRWTAKGNMSTALRLFWPAFMNTLWGFWRVVGTSLMRFGNIWTLLWGTSKGCYWHKGIAQGLQRSLHLQRCRHVCNVFAMLLHRVRMALLPPCSRIALRALNGYTGLFWQSGVWVER